MKPKSVNKQLLFLAIMTLITTLTWIGIKIYWIFHQNTIPAITKKQMESFKPQLNNATVEALKGNVSFSEEELNQ